MTSGPLATTPSPGPYGRHPGTVQHLTDLASEHLPTQLRDIAQPIEALAYQLADQLPDGPRLTTGLHLLVQAKDALVRARVAQLKGEGFTVDNTPEPVLREPARVETDDDRIVAKMRRDKGLDV